MVLSNPFFQSLLFLPAAALFRTLAAMSKNCVDRESGDDHPEECRAGQKREPPTPSGLVDPEAMDRGPERVTGGLLECLVECGALPDGGENAAGCRFPVGLQQVPNECA